MELETPPVTGAETAAGVGAGSALIFLLFFIWFAGELTAPRR